MQEDEAHSSEPSESQDAAAEASAPDSRAADVPSQAPDLSATLATIPYHGEIIEYLKAAEPEQWKWFASTEYLEEHARNARLELLKSCYRFEPEQHADLYAVIERAKVPLGLDIPVTLYQSQSATAMNAFLSYMPGEAHIVLEGPVRSTLTEEELCAALAHELTHYLLWERAQKELLIAEQMLSAMASQHGSEPSHIESVRLFHLYLEVHADRGSLVALRDPLIAISSLIKILTGLQDAQAESYLRQSEEIFGQQDAQAEELTHPEAFIRARALKLWSDSGPEANDAIARMIEGPVELRSLTLTRQKTLADLTRRLLGRFFEPPWARTPVLLAHARLFFPDFDPDQRIDGPPLSEALQDVADSVKKYFSYVLLDLATADRQLEQAPLAASLRLAEDAALTEPFVTIAADELQLSKRQVKRLQQEAPKILEGAHAAGTDEA